MQLHTGSNPVLTSKIINNKKIKIMFITGALMGVFIGTLVFIYQNKN